MPGVLLGIGGLLSDPACCIIRDGLIASAVEQLKVARQDRPGEFPDKAFHMALRTAEVEPHEIKCVAIARPFALGPESNAQLEFRNRFPEAEIVIVEHHDAHAASAYYASGFNQAAVLSVDRAGDFRSGALYSGGQNQLTRVRELYFPDSLGDLFNRVTELLGFEPRADEHKVQWLSTSGQPRYIDVFRSILHPDAAGWPHIKRAFFDSDRLTKGGFSECFYREAGVRSGDPLPDDVKADIASSLQASVGEVVKGMLGEHTQHVAVAGGLFLNALLVRTLEQEFSNVFVQPASGNAGTALGAALFAFHNFCRDLTPVPFTTLYLGPEYSDRQIKQVLENCKLRFRYILTDSELINEAIGALADNKIIAWMQGRLEFGPRALGNRSILASPLNPYSTENLNVYIKHREGFRKFAASVPEELASEYFHVGPNARYLATVGEVKPRYRMQFAPAILGESLVRVHTVRREDNPLFHELLLAAGRSSGLPVLYNTSFNLFGDPLVCTPRDAVRSFFSSGIDALFAGHFYLEK